MNDKIRAIIEAGTRAPSGDNVQPWRLLFGNGKLELHNIPDADTSLYNVAQYGSYFAHGAMIENMVIAGVHFGYTLDIDLFPDPSDKDHVATIRFKEATPKEEPLYDAIARRATNRKPYRKEPLDEKKALLLEDALAMHPEITLLMATSKEKKAVLATAISLNERLILECRAIHDPLFEMINWTEEEDQVKRRGLYLKTLELAPPQVAAFKLFANDRILAQLNKIGIGRLLPKATADLYRHSGAIVAFLFNEYTPKSFVEAGRAIERVWLTATSLDLRMAPVTAIPYLALRIERGEGDMINRTHQTLIIDANEGLRKTFEISDQKIAMLMRVGEGKPPSARSVRVPLEGVLTIIPDVATAEGNDTL